MAGDNSGHASAGAGPLKSEAAMRRRCLVFAGGAGWIRSGRIGF
ncbi:hypothetical protein [Sphingosinicella sp. BN140058]|nr:hypothetical protein [Sphingosinicella sp. BN140058]